MSAIPDIVTISQLRQDASAILKRAAASGEPVFITQHGRASAVLVSAGAYERAQHDFETLAARARRGRHRGRRWLRSGDRDGGGRRASRRVVTLRVRLTRLARARVPAALASIRADRPPAARAFQHRVNAVLARLADFPDSGRVVPELPDLQFREVTVDPNRFFCRVKGGTVWVVAAWHGAQIPDAPGEVIEG